MSEEQTTELAEIIPIELELVPLLYRKAWKTKLTEVTDIIKDQAIVGPSKVFSDCKYPFCASLVTEDRMAIIFKMVKKSLLEGGQDTVQQYAFTLPRKGWKKQILKIKENEKRS
jgi:hypothetical protein